MRRILASSRALLACILGLAPLAGHGATIQVLWYTYAHPESMYVGAIEKLARLAHTLPKSSGLVWKVTFFSPGSPAPAFDKYNVLVIHSGEPGLSGQYFPYLGRMNEPATPDYSGILKNKAAIVAARGERTFITGADAEVHAIWGDTGHAPPDPSGKNRRVNCKPEFSPRCWDGALGHLVNAVNWAASGRGLGIVSMVAGEHPKARWWGEADSFLRAELEGRFTVWDKKASRENNPLIPDAAQAYPLNSGLTAKGLSNWRWSFHAGFSGSVPGYVPVVVSTTYPGMSVAIATARFAAASTAGPAGKGVK